MTRKCSTIGTVVAAGAGVGANFARLSICRPRLLYCLFVDEIVPRGGCHAHEAPVHRRSRFPRCSRPGGLLESPSALGSRDARVSINGKATNALQPVTCTRPGRVGRSRPSTRSRISATIALGNEPTAQAVDIRNLGNFTGTYWEDNLGKAQSRRCRGSFTISGEAEGFFA